MTGAKRSLLSAALVAALGLVCPVRATEPAPMPRLVDRFGDPLPPGALLRVGTTRLRQVDVCALAFTADRKLVSFGRDYIVRTWDLASGRQLRQREFDKDKLHRDCVGWLSPDARRLAVQYADRVKVYDVATGRELAVVTLTDRLDARAWFSPDGARLAVVDQQGKLQLCDVGANSCRDLAKLGNSHTSDVAFSRDGKRLAVANFSRGVVVWELATDRELIRFNPGGEFPALAVDFDATGDVLAILEAAALPRFHFVRVSTGQSPDGWSAPNVGADVEWARFGPDDSTVLIGGRESVQWVDPKAGKAIHPVDTCATVRPAF